MHEVPQPRRHEQPAGENQGEVQAVPRGSVSSVKPASPFAPGIVPEGLDDSRHVGGKWPLERKYGARRFGRVRLSKLERRIIAAIAHRTVNTYDGRE